MGPCTKEDKKKCLASNPEGFLEILCRSKDNGKPCPKRDYEPHEYVIFLNHLYILQEALFPFEADTLTMDTWLDLGFFRQKMNARRYSPLDPESGRSKPPKR